MVTTASGPSPMPVPLGTGTQVAYGVGQVAGQVFRDIPALLLLFFMTNALGISPALAGISIFLPKLVWGVICDLSVGAISDRFRNALNRRWWLLIGAVGAPFAMILVFHVPAWSEGAKALYVSLAFSLYMLVFSTFSVPYLAIASDLAADPHRRTVLMAWRLVFTSVGVLVADSLMPIFIQYQGGKQPAYEAMSYILALVCPLCLVIAFRGASAARRNGSPLISAPKTQGFPVREAIAALLAPRFSVLLVSYLVQLVGNGISYGAMLYFLTYGLGRSDALTQVGLITIIACAAIIASQPVWVFAARRLGKKTTYIVSSLLYGAVMGGWGLLGPMGIGVSYAFAALLGISNSGWTLMGFSMVSDMSDDGRAGLYASIWVAADKIGFALGGTLLLGLVLATSGFDSQRAFLGLAQSHSAVNGVLVAFGVLPGIASTLAAGIFGRWGRSAQSAAF